MIVIDSEERLREILLPVLWEVRDSQPAILREPLEPLPRGVRPHLRRLVGLVAAEPSMEALLHAADSLDLRDLNEYEVAFLEGCKVKTVQSWRVKGGGPEFRKVGSRVAYPLRWYLQWRENGRRTRTDGK